MLGSLQKCAIIFIGRVPYLVLFYKGALITLSTFAVRCGIPKVFHNARQSGALRGVPRVDRAPASAEGHSFFNIVHGSTRRRPVAD